MERKLRGVEQMDPVESATILALPGMVEEEVANNEAADDNNAQIPGAA
jgi:hypothetical protein